MEVSEYISREAAIARLKRIVEVNRLRTDRAWFTPDGVEYLINEIPAADVRPVEKAHFSLVDGYNITALGWDIKGLECSNCGATYIAQTWVRKFNYCPNCGARMEANDV